MSKILILENDPTCCEQCCFYDFDKYNNHYFCIVEQEKIDNILLLPDWCPLREDITEYTMECPACGKTITVYSADIPAVMICANCDAVLETEFESENWTDE